MPDVLHTMPPKKQIALIAHDGKKDDLLDWAHSQRETLGRHDLFATGTTGRLLEQHLGLPVQCMQSGPLGGDLEIAAMIARSEINILIFFWDPLESQPHEPDVRALLRMAVVWNIPAATNRATADFMFFSPLLSAAYERNVPDYNEHRERLTLKGFTESGSRQT